MAVGDTAGPGAMKQTEKIDRRRQRELLALVLDDGPRLTLSELQARLGDPADVERAVETLIANDLLVRGGDEVGPTPAATRFSELIPVART